MSVGRFLQQAAAGNAGDPVYVDDVFSTFLYGKDGNSFSVDNGIDLANEGGLVWIKSRTATNDHHLFNTESGPLKRLYSNSSTNEGTQANTLTSFNSDGFTVGSSSYINSSSYDYVSWTFRKAPGFFDIVTYTGNGSPGQARTLSHNLGSVPGMIIVKSTSNTANWAVYHRKMDSSNPENYSMYLDVANGRATSDYWRQTAPTATEFTIGWDGDVNASGYEYIAYLFAHDAQEFGTDSDESIIKCGTYTGNGSTNGPEIDLGFEAQWVLIKNTGAVDWIMADNMRGMSSGGNDPYLRPSTTAAEYTSYDWIQPTASGFKLTNNGSSLNSNGGTFIYMAIRRPHKPASEFAATDLFDVRYGQNTTPVVTTGFPVDFFIERNPTGSDGNYFINRLTGINYLQSNSSGTGGNASLARLFDFNDGAMSAFSSAASYLIYSFRRAPGFFDIVVYTGSSSAQEISHNLGVAPELIIQKCRTQGSYPWNSWYSGLTNSQYVNLSTDAAVASSSNLWGTNATVATDSVFRTGSGNTGVDGSTSDTHIAYLFASAEGISKVGTFTRTSGDTTNVDCGFSNGARFVLWKRVSGGTGNWTVYDTVRGIVTGNDPYFFLNSTSGQVTSTDYIDPYSAGFTVASGIATGTFFFLAIA